jgi:hypothetical protein
MKSENRKNGTRREFIISRVVSYENGRPRIVNTIFRPEVMTW